jgi:hypothetical protein
MSEADPNQNSASLPRFSDEQRRRLDRLLIKAVRDGAEVTMDDADWNCIREAARRHANTKPKN